MAGSSIASGHDGFPSFGSVVPSYRSSHHVISARGYVRCMSKRARTTAGLLVAMLVAGGTVTIAAAGSSSKTNPAPVTTPYHPAFEAANFGGPTDNPWLPLRPGTVLRYRGEDAVDARLE